MWSANPDVLVTDLNNELVLLHPTSSEMFSLNTTARVLWQALPAPLDELVGVLVGRYGVNDEQARLDAQQVMLDLKKRDLVRES